MMTPRLVSSQPGPLRADVEEELYAAIIANAPGWQRSCFDRYYGLVHGLLLKSLGPRAEISDLAGDVFVTFFANAQRIRTAVTIRSYLISITMNIARREMRRRKRRELFHRFDGGSGDFEHEPGSDDPKAKAALIQLSRILDGLGPDDRAAFVLHNLERMQIAEIAGALQVSESTAKRRVRRANEHVLKRVSRNALLADYIRHKSERSQ
jgi:RNA polymerase sigma-70 factor (ECF subfamily)